MTGCELERLRSALCAVVKTDKDSIFASGVGSMKQLNGAGLTKSLPAMPFWVQALLTTLPHKIEFSPPFIQLASFRYLPDEHLTN